MASLSPDPGALALDYTLFVFFSFSEPSAYQSQVAQVFLHVRRGEVLPQVDIVERIVVLQQAIAHCLLCHEGFFRANHSCAIGRDLAESGSLWWKAEYVCMYPDWFMDYLKESKFIAVTAP